jgi:hypothetical protein
MRKNILASTAAAAVLAFGGAALAQDYDPEAGLDLEMTTQTALTPIAMSTAPVETFQGAEVRSEAGLKLGEVVEVETAGDAGDVSSLVVENDAGDRRALPAGKASWNAESETVVSTAAWSEMKMVKNHGYGPKPDAGG